MDFLEKGILEKRRAAILAAIVAGFRLLPATWAGIEQPTAAQGMNSNIKNLDGLNMLDSIGEFLKCFHTTNYRLFSVEVNCLLIPIKGAP